MGLSSELQVNGKIFYLDPDHCQDKQLLQLLTPADPDALPANNGSGHSA